VRFSLDRCFFVGIGSVFHDSVVESRMECSEASFELDYMEGRKGN